MSEKSHVSMAQHQCIVCGTRYDTGELLLDKRLKASMERYTVVGTGMCPEHQQLKDDGFVALIELNSAERRTGRLAHLRRVVWPHLFSAPLPENMVAYVEKGVMDMIEQQAARAAEEG